MVSGVFVASPGICFTEPGYVSYLCRNVSAMALEQRCNEPYMGNLYGRFCKEQEVYTEVN